MQHRAPPQYSPDGRWWWNGYYWHPVDQPVSSPEEERTRRTPVPWIGLIALLLLLLLVTAPAALSWLSRQGVRLGAGPIAPLVAPTAAATPRGTSAVERYRQTVTADEDRFQAAAGAVAGSCAPAALAAGSDACQAALQSMDDAVGGFRSDLDAQPAPSCLRPADAELRAALALYHQAIQQEQSGLDQGDAAAVLQGAATMGQATDHLRTASALLPTPCR